MRRPEELIHRAVVQHLELRKAPGVMFTHPASGGGRSKAEAGIMKALGVRPGWPDLVGVVFDGAGEMRVWGLELKAPQGRLTKEQREWIKAVSDAGHYAGWASSVDDAVDLLAEWGVIE